MLADIFTNEQNGQPYGFEETKIKHSGKVRDTLTVRTKLNINQVRSLYIYWSLLCT